MNIEKSRKYYNLAIEKSGELFNIVRFVNGFDNKPVTILKNIPKDKIEAKFNRALELIGSTMTDWLVFLRPGDRNKLVELVLIIEDSGINTTDIKIQDNGIIYFKVKGETDSDVRNNVESILRENGFEYDTNTVTVSRGDAIKERTKKSEIVDYGQFSKVGEVTQQGVDTSDVPEETQDDVDPEFEQYEAIKSNPILLNNPEIKEKYEYLKKKFATTIQQSPSIDESDVDLLKEVNVSDKVVEYLNSLDKTFAKSEDLISDLLTNGFTVDEIKNTLVNHKDLFIEHIK